MTTEPTTPDVPTKTFTITIQTPDGSLPPAEVCVPDMPMGLADIVPPIYQLCNGTVSLAIKKGATQDRPVSCGPECGVCCKQLVPLSIPEALFLVDHVQQMPLGERAEILRRFRKNISELEKHGLLEPLRTINEHNTTPEIPAAYWRLGLFCPFLINDSCHIHQARPCACREYNVTSPPAGCADPFVNDIARIKIHRKMTTALSMVAAHLLNAKPVLIPMPLLFDWYESHEDHATLRWPGIGLFDLTLDCALGTTDTTSRPSADKIT